MPMRHETKRGVMDQDQVRSRGRLTTGGAPGTRSWDGWAHFNSECGAREQLAGPIPAAYYRNSGCSLEIIMDRESKKE